MTERASRMRALRNVRRKEVETAFSQTRAGQHATVRQVKAAAKKIMQNITAKFPATKPSLAPAH